MRGLAEFIMRGPIQAAGTAAMLGLLIGFFPPFFCISGAAIGLATLRHGAYKGAGVVATALAIAGLVSMLTVGTTVPAFALTFMVWLPVGLCTLVLRTWRAQGPMLVTACALAALFTTAMHVFTGDVAAFWYSAFKTLQIASPQDTLLVNDEDMRRVAVRMNVYIAVGLELGLFFSALVARWWQAVLYRPQGFQREFHCLRIPRPMLLVTAMVAIIAYWQVEPDQPSLGFELLVLCLWLYVLQGLSVLHQRILARGRSVQWLIMTYCALFFVHPVAVAVLAAIGMIDGVVDLRARKT